MQAMIFAAGKGTRLKPLTDVIPKALVPIADVPLLLRVINKIEKNGADNIVINVHHHARQIINYIELLRLKYPKLKIQISDESDLLLETGGGIRKAKDLFRNDEAIIIHNCDILSDLDLSHLYDIANKKKCDALLVVSERETQRFLIFDNSMKLLGWTNISTNEVRSPFRSILSMNGKKDIDWEIMGLHLFAFSGIHCISPKLLNVMKEWPERFPIMDFYLKACASYKIEGLLESNLHLLDVGKLDTLSIAENFIKKYNIG